MKNKIIALTLLCISITFENVSRAADKPSAVKTALTIGGICLAVVFTVFYGGKKWKQYQEEEESIKRCNAWLKERNLPPMETKQETEARKKLNIARQIEDAARTAAQKKQMLATTEALKKIITMDAPREEKLKFIKELHAHVTQYQSRQQATA